MKAIKTSLLLFIGLVWMAEGYGQDVIYSQFYANPIYLNPALAGSTLSTRISLNYRNQWPTLSQGYNSISASWDQPVEKISGAVGVMINADAAAGGIYNSLSANGLYAYRLEVSRNLIFTAALQAGYVQHRLDWSKLIFEDQAGQTVPTQLNVGKLDFSTGVMAVYNEYLYLGMSVNHLTQPDMSYYEGITNKMDRRFTVHAGAIIDIREGSYGKEKGSLSISPNVIFEQQGNFHQLNIGMYGKSYPLIAGLWYRHSFENPDAAILLLGLQQKNYKVEYSFDYTLSRLKIGTGEAHEISIVFLIKNKQTTHRYRELKIIGY